VVLSLVGFLCGVGVLGLMLWNAQHLVALGLTGNVFYVVLLPLGLSASAFLFGVMGSYARYRGRVLGGALELGGPFVGFALVVIGGFVLIPNPSAFSVTVYVHGEQGVQGIVLRNSGHVVMDLGPDRRSEAIGEKGEAHFAGIPSSFRGQEVPVWVESEDIEPGPAIKQRLEGSSLYVTVRPRALRISGHVQDEGRMPVAGAAIQVADITAKTDASGYFSLDVSRLRSAGGLSLHVQADGYLPWQERVVPNANEALVVLRRIE
jgi:hypothetical protein